MSKEVRITDPLHNVDFISNNIKTNSYDIHYHSVYEIYYFLEGNADYLVEGKKYHLTPHSLLLLSPHTFHGVRVNSEVNYIRCAIHFDGSVLSPERRQFLLSSFPGNEKNSPKEVFYEHTEEFELLPLFRQFIQSQKQPAPFCTHYYPIYLEALLAQISIMCRSLSPTIAVSNVPSSITEIIHYLNDHLEEPITLDFLSKRFYISKYYMNRAFKKATGTTVMDYLIYKRVVMAKQLMYNGDTASDAARMSGFGDYSSFYRSYRKIIGCSPNSQKNSANP